jgi:hypothetical protein
MLKREILRITGIKHAIIIVVVVIISLSGGGGS